MKTIEELEQAIRDIIMDEYNRCFCGKLTIIKNDEEYIIKIHVRRDNPIIIAYQTTDQDKLLELVRDEIRIKRLSSVDFFEGKKYYQYER